jgi:inhibitor of growth protein 3
MSANTLGHIWRVLCAASFCTTMPRIPAAPPIGGHSSSSPTLGTAHSLLVLSEYAHTLDSLPLDLSRQFADLRELDAVLSASTVSVTQKIYELIDLVENPEAPKQQRLAKLGEIAEEAQRLKLGGEDKIRVASQAAENVRMFISAAEDILMLAQLASHKAHMGTLLSAIAPYDTSFTPSHLYLRTSYPHLPPRPAQDAVPLEGGRRRRGAVGAGGRGQLGGMLAVEALSPVKGRKRAREEEDPPPTPRRERESNTTTTHRRGGAGTAKARKSADSLSCVNIHAERPHRVETHTHVAAHVHRANSPSAESVLSITSHAVGQPPTSNTRPPAPVAQPAPQAVPRPPAPASGEDGEPADEGEQDGGRYCYCQGPSYGEMVGCDDEHCAYEWVSRMKSQFPCLADTSSVPSDVHRLDGRSQGRNMVLR